MWSLLFRNARSPLDGTYSCAGRVSAQLGLVVAQQRLRSSKPLPFLRLPGSSISRLYDSRAPLERLIARTLPYPAPDIGGPDSVEIERAS